MDMSIANLSTAMATMDLGTKVDVAIAKIGMDTMEQNGENLIEAMNAMEKSVAPHLAGNWYRVFHLWPIVGFSRSELRASYGR